MKLTTTLNRIKEHNPCEDGWEKLINHLGDDFDFDVEIDLLTILESNDIADCLWSFRTVTTPCANIAVKFAIECAKRVLKYFSSKYPNDNRPRRAIELAEKYIKDPTDKNAAAAYAAADAADAAAYDAADVAAYAAADAAYAAYAADAADAAANATADAADERKEQEKILIKLLS